MQPHPVQPHPEQPPPTYSATEPPISWPDAVRTLATTVAVFALVGLAAGVVWWLLTDPPTYQVVANPQGPAGSTSVVQGEEGLGEAFGVEVVFFSGALVGGLVGGLACAALFRTRGLVTLLSVLAGGAVACFVALRTGRWLGPADLMDQSASAAVGDVLTSPLSVEATGFYLVWPIAAVAGLMVIVSMLTPVPEQSTSGPSVG